MEPNKERLQKVVDRMRFGNDKQIEGALHEGSGFCAVGIFCDVYAQENGIEWKESAWVNGTPVYSIQGNSALMSEEVANWFGFEAEPKIVWDGEPRGVMEMNDTHGMPFPEIGDLIHKEFEL